MILTPILLAFLIAYLLHSSVLLACAMLAHKMGWLKHRSLAESIWRLALFGAILTAGLQVAWTSKLVTHESPLSMATTAVEVKPTAPSIEDMQSDRAMNLPDARLPVAAALNDAPTDSTIRLPSSFKFYAEALTLAWGVFAVFVFVGISLAMFYLNRKIALMPELDDDGLLQFAATRLPAGRQIHIHHGDAWSSPLLCPNGHIFLPNWALEELDHSQCKAMLAHEIAHLLRHDRYWRLAHQIMLRLFFFQVFNRYAVKQLELLAEFDCDQAALEHSNAESFTQTLMQCAQMHINNHPTFALPMAKPSSLLQRISLLLNEERMPAQSFSKKSLFALCAVSVTCLSALSYAAPQFQFEDLQIKDRLITSLSSSEAVREKVQNELGTLDSSTDYLYPNKTVRLTGSATSTLNIDKTRTQITPYSESKQQSTSSISNTSLIEAQHAFENAQYERALQLFTELANLGDAQAQLALGEMFWYGEGTMPNIPLAKSWFNKAADQGNARARQFVDLLAEREKRSDEINFYTTNFDGGKLKWKEETCPSPQLPTETLTSKRIQSTVSGVNAKLDCYNSYVSMLKNNLAEMRYLPLDLKRIMRAEEIEQAAQLTRDLYYKMGLQARASTDQLLTQYQRWSEHWKAIEFEEKQRLTIYMNKRIEEDFEHRSMIRPETGERTVITTVSPTEKK